MSTNNAAREALHTTFRKYLSITDPDFLDIICAVAIHSQIHDKGNPLWITAIGEQGSGKTQLAWRPFQGLPLLIHNIDSITQHTFITGLKTGKDLLPELDGKLVLFKDFTSITMLNKDVFNTLMSQMRHIYDGHLEASFGSDKKRVEYDVTFDVIACMTTDANRQSREVTSRMGERMLPIMLHSDSSDIAEHIIKNNGKTEEIDEALQEAMRQFIDSMCSDNNLESYYNICIPPIMAVRIMGLVDLVTMLRTVIPLERDGTVDNFYKQEGSGRILDTIITIAKGLAFINGHPEITMSELDVVKRICYDLIEKKRIVALELIYRDQYSISELEKPLRLPTTAVRRMMESLWTIGVFDKKNDGGSVKYILMPAVRQAIMRTRLLDGGPIRDDIKPMYFHDVIWEW